jgi:hypothetical protein
MPTARCEVENKRRAAGAASEKTLRRGENVPDLASQRVPLIVPPDPALV